MLAKYLKVAIAAGMLLMFSAVTMTVFAQADEAEQKSEKAVIQYKLVPVTLPMTQEQFQTVLTTQGNAGWRFHGPFVVGTGPIPNKQVLLFSKP